MNAEVQAQAQAFLAAYAQGETPPGGWLFGTALQQSRLDFTDDSLGRVDHLLTSVRERAKPSAETLFNTEAGRNFCAMVAYYLGEFIRRRTGSTVEWHDRESAVDVLPKGSKLPQNARLRLVAVVPERSCLMMLLDWVERCALSADRNSSARQVVEENCRLIASDGPPVWAAGMYAVGRLAAWQMQMAYMGGAVWPKMLKSSLPNTFVSLGSPGISDLSESLEQGGSHLDKNFEGNSWQVLSYDGFREFEGESLDAVMVLLRTYVPSPLFVKMAFPYRPAQEGQAFQILSPWLLEANVDNETVAGLNPTVTLGIQSFRWVGDLGWDELSAAAPANRHHLLPQPAQPEMAQIMEKLRSSFEQRQQRMTDLSLASMLASKPDWMRPDDSLNEVFARQKLLLTEGRIVWGALVQANQLMFEPGNANCPGLLVHSPDEHFDAHPMELRAVGRAYFALKGTQPDDPELARLAQLVTDEMDRTLQFRLPRVFCSQDVCSGIFMLFRKHIPNGVLSCGLFPVLTHPATPAVLMLPFEFWPIELIVMWKEGRL